MVLIHPLGFVRDQHNIVHVFYTDTVCVLWNKSPVNLCKSVISVQILKRCALSCERIKNKHIQLCSLVSRRVLCKREFKDMKRNMKLAVRKQMSRDLGTGNAIPEQESCKEQMSPGRR